MLVNFLRAELLSHYIQEISIILMIIVTTVIINHWRLCPRNVDTNQRRGVQCFKRNGAEMGCNSSSVVPLADSDIDDACGIKVRVNPSTPELKTEKNHATESSKNGWTNGIRKKTNNGVKPPPLAFEVPIFEDKSISLIKKHPPKKFRRLEEQQLEPHELSHEVLDERQKEAERRRKELLSQRVMSAKNPARRKRLIHSDAFSQDSDVSSEKNI